MSGTLTCAAMCGNVQCAAMCGNVWQCMAMCGNAWQLDSSPHHQIGFVLDFVKKSTNTETAMLSNGNVRQCAAMCGNVWQCMAMCGNGRQCAAMCGMAMYQWEVNMCGNAKDVQCGNARICNSCHLNAFPARDSHFFGEEH